MSTLLGHIMIVITARDSHAIRTEGHPGKYLVSCSSLAFATAASDLMIGHICWKIVQKSFSELEPYDPDAPGDEAAGWVAWFSVMTTSFIVLSLGLLYILGISQPILTRLEVSNDDDSRKR
jgi:hypothetical protein